MTLFHPQSWSFGFSVALFVAAVAFITVFGVAMTKVADRLSRGTLLGQAVMGAVFVGASTSLAEIVTSVTAAAEGHAELAVSNAVGSIAGQTAFLGIADMTYRKANLEHAAASAENLILGAFLVTMLAVPLLAMAVPRMSVMGMHPATPAMLVLYVFGVRLVARTHRAPMWRPRLTRETWSEPATRRPAAAGSLARLWAAFVLYAAMTALAGWIMARAAIVIAARTGISETVVGGLFTGLSSSLPELITAVTAVRLGALTLAVGNVLGGNAFDTLVVAFSDAAYRSGSIYQALSQRELFLIALSILLTGILLMGLLYREKHGIGNIGLESFLVLILYAGAFVLLGLYF